MDERIVSDRIVSDRITVPFSGPGAGTAPLTWGQKAIIQDMRTSDWTYNISGAHPLPEGLTVEDIAARLSRLMGKHPALRTRLGTDAEGRPCQVVSASGEIDLEVVTFADELERDAAVNYANKLWLDWMATPIARHSPWSLRMAVMRHRGAAVSLVLTIGHLVADGVGALLLMTDLGIGELAGRAVDPDALCLADLARREQTPEVRRVSDRAMRYWEGQLRPLPPLTFGAPKSPDYRPGERCRNVRFHSPAAYLAVLAIAQRTRTDTSRVLLAVIAIAIGRTTGVNPLTTHVVASNRFRPALADVIGSVVQNSVLTLDLDGNVGDVVARARQATTLAWMQAYYDPDQLAELTARLDAERGHPARITCRISDRRFSTRVEAEAMARSASVTAEAIRAQLPETFLKWHKYVYRWTDQVFINIEDRPKTVYLQMVFDTEVFTTQQVEAMLRAVEEVAIEAAFDPDALTRVAPDRMP
ncbi:condensation domain-containing protein [Saccharothrix deserti]|uniref:condensation domain-containing protein n=1 Tax=Saccharothrix deserti TaxID=2593674 RepID=UPI00131B29CD|nr:condensation domain-containing protein [Saccharothrix deserti]